MRRALLLTTIALSLAGCAALQARDTRRHQVRGRRFRLSTATPRSRKSGCRGRVSPTWACRIKPMNRQDAPTFRRPKVILPVPTPSPTFQHVQAGVPDTQLTREATGLLREFSTPLLFNHSHRVLFWANELGRQTGKTFDAVGPPRRRDRPPPRSHPRVRRPRRLEYRISLLRRLAELRSEEHTSELQSPCNLVCRLLLEKKKKK